MGRLKMDVQGQWSGRILDIDGQGVEGLEIWTIFMDLINLFCEIGEVAENMRSSCPETASINRCS